VRKTEGEQLWCLVATPYESSAMASRELDGDNNRRSSAFRVVNKLGQSREGVVAPPWPASVSTSPASLLLSTLMLGETPVAGQRLVRQKVNALFLTLACGLHHLPGWPQR
jgi:hypothetical protein